MDVGRRSVGRGLKGKSTPFYGDFYIFPRFRSSPCVVSALICIKHEEPSWTLVDWTCSSWQARVALLGWFRRTGSPFRFRLQPRSININQETSNLFESVWLNGLSQTRSDGFRTDKWIQLVQLCGSVASASASSLGRNGRASTPGTAGHQLLSICPLLRPPKPSTAQRRKPGQIATPRPRATCILKACFGRKRGRLGGWSYINNTRMYGASNQQNFCWMSRAIGCAIPVDIKIEMSSKGNPSPSSSIGRFGSFWPFLRAVCEGCPWFTYGGFTVSLTINSPPNHPRLVVQSSQCNPSSESKSTRLHSLRNKARSSGNQRLR